jgi:hypothetical protein
MAELANTPQLGKRILERAGLAQCMGKREQGLEMIQAARCRLQGQRTCRLKVALFVEPFRPPRHRVKFHAGDGESAGCCAQQFRKPPACALLGANDLEIATGHTAADPMPRLAGAAGMRCSFWLLQRHVGRLVLAT